MSHPKDLNLPRFRLSAVTAWISLISQFCNMKVIQDSLIPCTMVYFWSDPLHNGLFLLGLILWGLRSHTHMVANITPCVHIPLATGIL